LELLYKQKNVVGGFAKFFYWSSSELGIYGAWGRSFRGGLQLYFTKGNGLRVRAVRAF
jgi:hypothetical protein